MMLRLWEEMVWLLFMKIVTPKVSCIIMGDDLNLIYNYNHQIYRNRELIVITRNDFYTQGAICKKIADHIDDNWAKDLAIELTTGDKICWWEQEHHPYYLSLRVKEDIEDDVYFDKEVFYKAQNMLYSGSKLKNKEYYEI